MPTLYLEAAIILLFVNRGYWDPEESARTKWTTTYAAELDARGLSHDFTGLSELLLGQAQPAQFQSADQTGYWWGSRVSDDGKWTELNAVDPADTNSNSHIPRSYITDVNSYGVIYNWYAAVAEVYNDSICPKGWALPDGYQSFPTSWYSLLFSSASYEYAKDDMMAKYEVMKSPFFFTFAGRYSVHSGNLETVGTGSSYLTKVAGYNRLVINSGQFFTAGYYAADGWSIRCMK